MWAGPEWFILHESRAQTVLLSNVYLQVAVIARLVTELRLGIGVFEMTAADFRRLDSLK